MLTMSTAAEAALTTSIASRCCAALRACCTAVVQRAVSSPFTPAILRSILSALMRRPGLGITVFDTAPNIPLFQNLPVRVAGAELETHFQPTHSDHLGDNLAYTHSYYVDKSPLFASVAAEGNLAPLSLGQEQALIPLVTANFSYNHIFNLPAGSSPMFHADARYLGPSEGHSDALQAAGGAQPLVRISGQGVGDFMLSWRSRNEHYSVSA